MGESVEDRKFEVLISGWTGALEDWRRSLQAPPSELPELTAEEKEFARRWGIGEEAYARSRLSLEYGRRRRERRAIQLGRAVEEILGDMGAAYQLKAVIAEMMKARWVLRIQTPQKVVNVAVDRELADDIVDSNTIQDQDRLRELVVSSLQRTGQIGKK